MTARTARLWLFAPAALLALLIAILLLPGVRVYDTPDPAVDPELVALWLELDQRLDGDVCVAQNVPSSEEPPAGEDR